MSRPYRMTQRAAAAAGTRQRIVDAAIALHDEVGPDRTTISAIAERAGVQRLTVYRHFPDEEAILTACSSQWQEQNPPPHPSGWEQLDDPAVRLRWALEHLYGYYARNERMFTNLARAASDIPFIAASMGEFAGYLEEVSRGLLRGWNLRGTRRKQVQLLVRHALQFETWRSLAREGVGVRDSVSVLCAAITALASEPADMK